MAPCPYGQLLRPARRVTTSNRSFFDLTGGEDVHLFRRMIDDGALVVAASQARTVGYRPATRANLYWILRRAFRNGGTIVEVDWGRCDWKRRVRRTLDAGVKGTSYAAKAGRLWRRDKTTAVEHLVRSCQEFGKSAAPTRN